MRVSSTSANVVPLLEISAGEIIEIFVVIKLIASECDPAARLAILQPFQYK